jgi:hypothetical protein
LRAEAGELRLGFGNLRPELGNTGEILARSQPFDRSQLWLPAARDGHGII